LPHVTAWPASSVVVCWSKVAAHPTWASGAVHSLELEHPAPVKTASSAAPAALVRPRHFVITDRAAFPMPTEERRTGRRGEHDSQPRRRYAPDLAISGRDNTVSIVLGHGP
jgi:hypothetical protein